MPNPFTEVNIISSQVRDTGRDMYHIISHQGVSKNGYK